MSEDASKLEFETSEDVEIVPSFDSMGLKDELLRGIYAYGAARPRWPLQSRHSWCYTHMRYGAFFETPSATGWLLAGSL